MKDLKLKIVLDAADKISKPFKNATQSSAILRTGFQKTATELKDLKAVSRDIEAFKRVKSQMDANAIAMREAQQKAQRLGAEMSKSATVTKKMERAFDQARTQVLRLKDAQTQHQTTLSNVQGRLRNANISTKNLALSERKLASQIKITNTNLDAQGKKLDQLSAKTKKAQQAKAAYDKTLSNKANLSFVGFAGVETGRTAMRAAGSIINPGIAFEQSMSKVGSLARVDKTSQAFADLQNQAEQLGATTSFSATQAADGMTYLAMAGFKANDIIKTMPGMLALAKAGSQDLGTTADIASNILSGFGLEADQMNRVGDVLAATFTRSNVDLTMLGDSMKYVAPIAKELGASVEDAAAMSGLLGNVGIQGSQAGTALRAMFTRLAGPPKMARDAITRLGLATKDAQGNMRPMVDIMSDIAKKTEGMGNAERIEIFKQIAGEEAGTAFAELVNKGGAGEIAKFVDILHNASGEAKRIAEEMGDNTAGDITKFGSAYEALNITLTKTNITPMRDIINMGTNIVQMITNWVRENPVLAGTLLKVVAGGAAVVTVLGGMALAVAGILGPFAMAKMAFTTLLPLFPANAAGIKMVSLAMVANPIGAAITAIVVAGTILYNNWEPIFEWFTGSWDNVGEKLMQAGRQILKFISPFGWIIDKAIDFFGSDEEKKVAIETSDKVAAKKTAPIAAATAATAIAAAPALATTPIPSPPPTQIADQSNHTYQINIHPSPGMDEQAIAQMVRQEIERIKREDAARNRSRLMD